MLGEVIEKLGVSDCMIWGELASGSLWGLKLKAILYTLQHSAGFHDQNVSAFSLVTISIKVNRFCPVYVTNDCIPHADRRQTQYCINVSR